MQHHFLPSKLAEKIKEDKVPVMAGSQGGSFAMSHQRHLILPVSGSPTSCAAIINATLPKMLHAQTNALWHLLLSWGSRDGERTEIAIQRWSLRQQDPSGCTKEVLR